jgi:hypothetical protein
VVERANRVIKQIFDAEKYDLILQEVIFASNARGHHRQGDQGPQRPAACRQVTRRAARTDCRGASPPGRTGPCWAVS